VLPLPLLARFRFRPSFAFSGGADEVKEWDGDKGSTWTMSSHNWTMERMSDVFPTPNFDISL
jgi:hypothetical protein